MPTPAVRLVLLTASVVSLAACDRVFSASPTERVGYLRELVRARIISGDTLPIDACSMDRFMTGVPAWRDSLLPAERRTIADSAPCPATTDSVRTIPGRFVLTSWYRNWSGEYVIRGATPASEQGYRFTDGIFVGRERLENQRYYAGIAERRAATADSVRADSLTRDTIGRAGAVADTLLTPPVDTPTAPRVRPRRARPARTDSTPASPAPDSGTASRH